jgi:hypothetical protein
VQAACHTSGPLEEGGVGIGIFRSVKNRDVFPAAPKDGFTAVRKMPIPIPPSCTRTPAAADSAAYGKILPHVPRLRVRVQTGNSR